MKMIRFNINKGELKMNWKALGLSLVVTVATVIFAYAVAFSVITFGELATVIWLLIVCIVVGYLMIKDMV
jgi:ABC-type spermidine/putrescine transport system permease subunit I